ncbi:MAG: hypothetical protein IKC57_00990 [Alistipes sp.]|nr:hypothetical protein [Alistipes sp.]
MNRGRLLNMFVVVLLLLIAGCDTSDDPTPQPCPVVRITSCDITERSISVLITVLDAESAAWQCREWDGIPPIASNILSFGTPISVGEDMLVEIDGLLPEREYVVAVAAVAADRETTTHIRLSTLAENEEDDGGDDGGSDDGKEDDGGKEDDDTGNEPIELLGVLFDGAQLITTSDVATTVIELTSSDAQCSLLIDFKRMPTATLLADTYSCAEGDVVLLFSGAATSEDVVAAEGEVIVERDHEIYTLTIAFRSEPLTLKGEYEGEIAGLNVEQPDDGGAEDDDDNDVGEDENEGNDNDNEEDAPLLVSATATKIGRYWALTLASADGRTSLYVEVYGYNIDYDYLVPGTYRVKSYGYEFEEGDIDYYYSSLQMNGEKVQLASGTLDIKLDGEQYVIDVDITDAQSRMLETTYCGAIEVMPL